MSARGPSPRPRPRRRIDSSSPRSPSMAGGSSSSSRSMSRSNSSNRASRPSSLACPRPPARRHVPRPRRADAAARGARRRRRRAARRAAAPGRRSPPPHTQAMVDQLPAREQRPRRSPPTPLGRAGPPALWRPPPPRPQPRPAHARSSWYFLDPGLDRVASFRDQPQLRADPRERARAPCGHARGVDVAVGESASVAAVLSAQPGRRAGRRSAKGVGGDGRRDRAGAGGGISRAARAHV